jgi:hypothetical protein
MPLDNRDAFVTLVSRMIAYGAPVAPSETQPLVDYLFKTYGARKKN